MEKLNCQSCGMPLAEESLLSREKDGSKNSEYCLYCYENGEFKQPDMTLEGMVELCVPFLMKDSGMNETDARALLNNHLPHLKRWKTA